MQSTNTTGSNLASVTSVEVTSSEARTIRCLLEYSPSEAAFKRIRFTLRLKALSEASEPMVPAEVGERIGMPAKYAGSCLYWMLGRGLVEKPDKKRRTCQITEKGREYRQIRLKTRRKRLPKEVPKEVTKVVAKVEAKVLA